MPKYAISDIHGCGLTFEELLNSIGLNKSDELFILGDYINRMPRSKEVIDKIMHFQQNGYQIHTIQGNHEDMLLDYLDSCNPPSIFTETLESFGIKKLNQLDNHYIDWFRNLKLYEEDDAHIFVHAGLDFSQSNPLADTHNLMWIRGWYETINYKWLGDRKIIHGHEPITKNRIIDMRDQLDKKQVIDIDNGCFKIEQEGMGNLCCLNLDSLELHFQKNID